MTSLAIVMIMRHIAPGWLVQIMKNFQIYVYDPEMEEGIFGRGSSHPSGWPRRLSLAQKFKLQVTSKLYIYSNIQQHEYKISLIYSMA